MYFHNLIVLFLILFEYKLKIKVSFKDENAPFPYVFEKVGWTTIKWVVNIGAVFALFTSLLGAMFPLPRVLYAMGSDGVIFKFLAKIHPKTMTPIFGTIISGLLTGEIFFMYNFFFYFLYFRNFFFSKIYL